MQIYTHEFRCSDMVSPVGTEWDFYPYNHYSYRDMCFFDIETTGLSAATSSIYLIGAGYYSGDNFIVIQWFADDYNSEKDIINAFLEHISSYKVLLQYNGNTFDIPYIQNKCKRYRISCTTLNSMVHIDLYASLRRYGSLLGLPNKKLISYERYIGLIRDDTFNGGELIHVYSEYMQNRYLHRENDKLLNMLLLHNYEDITGLSQVASLMFLKELDKLSVDITNVKYNGDYINVCYTCSMPGNYSFRLELPCDIEVCHEHNIVCEWNNGIINLSIPVIHTTLLYYFTDYKDYYYMIDEGTVMHKSVAVYTDSSVRRKAKKSECYVSKTGDYIPVKKHGCFSGNTRIFRKNYTSKEYYIEYYDKMLEETDWLITYYRQLI